MKRHIPLAWLCASTILTSFGAAHAAETVQTNTLTDALAGGKAFADARYRFEYVDQDGLANEANAHTVRTRLGYETGNFHGFTGLIEFENITDLGDEDYNNTINGKTTYPTVADPEDTNLNRLQLSYTGLPKTTVVLGRQLINYGNQRFVGAVGWRQNDQTFDAISFKNQGIKGLTLSYAYATQVNRIFGTDSTAGIWDDTQIHMANAVYTGVPWGKFTGYAYLLDIPESASLSSATYGVRFEGKHALAEGWAGILNLEYAHQVDYADNTASIDFDYFSVEPGVSYGPWALKAQYESIEGDGTNALQFALGTNHAFDGWVDKFLTTPASGLVDANIGVTYTVKSANPHWNGTKVMVVYHDFSAEHGGASYGTEWNALVEQTFAKYYTAGIKLGAYDADGLLTDTTKIMPYIQFKFPVAK